MIRRSAVLAPALAAWLSGCGHSPPSRFFTLDPAPGAPLASPVVPAPIQVAAVHIPPDLDRPEVVSQIAPNQLTLSGQDRWAAPLGELMRRALAQDLSTRLPPGVLVFPDAPRPPGVRQLVVTILALRARPEGTVTMAAGWSLLAPDSSRTVAGQHLQLSAAAGSGSTGQARAISTILGQLADRIVGDLTSSSAPGAP